MFLAAKEQSAPGHPALKEKGSKVDTPRLDEALPMGKVQTIARPWCWQVHLKDA